MIVVNSERTVAEEIKLNVTEEKEKV